MSKISARFRRIIFAIFILIVIAVAFLLFLLQQQKTSVIETDSLSEHIFYEDFDGYSELSLFPYTTWLATDYYYYHKDGFSEPSIQIYMECTYDKDSYAKETKRLGALYTSKDDYVNYVYFDSEHFCVPAYVTIAGNQKCYEYALLLDENRIAYVYLQNIDEKSVKFDTSYLPSYYGVSGSGYSMYILTKETGEIFYTYSENGEWE